MLTFMVVVVVAAWVVVVVAAGVVVVGGVSLQGLRYHCRCSIFSLSGFCS